ncbi:MAG: NAD(P)H-dependent flavin oxidoreductase [Hyphomonadaceae bacterium]
MSKGVFASLRMPAMCAPMSFASSVPLALACSRARIVAGWQGGNVSTLEAFEQYLKALDEARREADGEGRAVGPPIVNFPARIVTDPEVGAAKLKLCEAYRPPLVLSSVGDPTELVKRAHDWGARVIHDAINMKHVEKGLRAGVDGVMLTCAGAGGHTGFLTPMAFVPKVRSIYDGLIIAAGGIASGSGIAAALTLGADIAALGTRFIATPESGVVEGHRLMIETVGMDDIMVSDAMNGVAANWMRPSVAQAGLDPDAMPQRRGPTQGAVMPAGVRPWRDIWSAGQSAGLIDAVAPVEAVVAQLEQEFVAANGARDWRAALARLGF